MGGVLAVARGVCRNRLVIGVVGMALGTAAVAAGEPSDDQLLIHRSARTGLATFVTAKDGGPISSAAVTAGAEQPPMTFLRRRGHLLGTTDPHRELQLEHTFRDGLGRTHTTYQQIHRGVPVFSGMVKVHQNIAGAVVAANGHFHPIPSKLDTSAKRSRGDAVARAADAAGIDDGDFVVERDDLVIVDPGWYGDPPSGEHLAYHLVLRSESRAIREAFFVDAHSGAVLDRWNLMPASRSRLVHDGNLTDALPGSPVRLEGGAPVSEPELIEANYAYDYAGDMYDFFSRTFGRDSIDDAGMFLILTVRSEAPNCPNAFWNGWQMVFCEETVTDDITAHEMGHGITDFTANLIYQNQPGQLNESYSDIWGELVDLFNGDVAFPGPPAGPSWPKDAGYTDAGTDTPNNARSDCSYSFSYQDGVRWIMGEDAAAFNGAIRDMWDPTCFGDPDRANSVLQTCSPSDNGGVHSGSGIPNHAFAIMTDGKTFNGQTVTGIGPIKAAAVWYRALTVYLTPVSDFRDAYVALNQAAQDLIGTAPIDPRTGNPIGEAFTAADAVEVNKALLAVEMNTEGACGAVAPVLSSTAPELCSPHARIYFADFENGNLGWTVAHDGPNGPPTPYDWVLTDELPFSRPGTACFCADPNIGDCQAVDESAIHSLISPVITIPADVDLPVLAFTHYLATEPGWDGGNVKLRVNGGAWQLIPSSAFLYNPYNAVLRNSIPDGNTNPLAGEDGWTGVGGRWGTSIVDLSDYVQPADALQIKFEFGKDGCTGFDGWYMDDVGILDCGGVTIVASNPASGAIDARRPYIPPDGTTLDGWNSITIELSHPSSGMWDSFETAELGGDGFAPGVAAVTDLGSGRFTVTLNRPIEPGAWTKIEHLPADWSAWLGYLPGDVDADLHSSTLDIDALIDALNALPTSGAPDHSTDIDRSGTVNARDILALIDLLNGSGVTPGWLDHTLPPPPGN